MKVTKEKTGPCEYELSVEVEPEQLQQPLRQAARRLSKRRPLAGFRPGKAPYQMVERMYGQEAIFDEMLDQIGNKLYQEALKESGLEPYEEASLDIQQLEPLSLKFTVPVQPEVTLGDYHTIRAKLKKPRVPKTEIEGILTRMQENNALWMPVERAVQMGDQVLLDIVGAIDGKEGTNQQDLTLEVTKEMTPPAFGENLVGIKPSETKEFDIQYPQDFQDQDLAGKTVHFSVTVKTVKEKELPALDDELAKTVGDFETLAQLRAKIKEQLREQKASEAKHEATDQAIDTLVKQATIEYPNVAVEREIDAMIRSSERRLQQQGFSLEGYLSMQQKTLAEWRTEMRPDAETRLKQSLAVAEFATTEGIDVDEHETEEEIDRITAPLGDRSDGLKETLSTGASYVSVINRLYQRKALERLLAIATGQADSSGNATKDAAADSSEKTSASS